MQLADANFKSFSSIRKAWFEVDYIFFLNFKEDGVLVVFLRLWKMDFWICTVYSKIRFKILNIQ